MLLTAWPRPTDTYPERYYAGLDLGQAADFSALAIAREDSPDAEDPPYTLGDLRRYPLGTSYRTIVADVRDRLWRLKLAPAALDDEGRAPRRKLTLVVDATGVGAGVVDLFDAVALPGPLLKVIITGGDTVNYTDGRWRVPKRDLVGIAQVCLQNRRLHVPPALPEAATLRAELQNFRVKIDPETAHDSYSAWRENQHDDLVLATALALWAGERGRRAVIRGVRLPGFGVARG